MASLRPFLGARRARTLGAVAGDVRLRPSPAGRDLRDERPGSRASERADVFGPGGRMKIVMVHNSYQQPGGEDASFRNARDLLKSAGHEIIEYLRSNDEAKKFVSLGKLALAKQTIWAGDTRREFRELLEREMPDIVHVQNTFVMISPSI